LLNVEKKRNPGTTRRREEENVWGRDLGVGVEGDSRNDANLVIRRVKSEGRGGERERKEPTCRGLQRIDSLINVWLQQRSATFHF